MKTDAEVTVIAERIARYPEPDLMVYHLRSGRAEAEAWFQPVKCGGGINLPGHPLKVAASEVCPDCLAGRVTM